MARPSRSIVISLPVQDVHRSSMFFRSLGFEIDEQWSDEQAACLVLDDHAYVMLVAPARFASLTGDPVADPRAGTAAILGVSAETQDEVDALTERALASGGSPGGDAVELGVMYSRGFHDLDGHLWEIIWINDDAIEGAVDVARVT